MTFVKDVYTIAFHPELEGTLVTSGMGHIKFWKMANTFTGLKLQGAVGKFGLSELSDINSFIQLPDGKVLSGTETGLLLLWEGGAIKCEIAIKGESVCHRGAIDVILLEDTEVLTGGDDGYVRLWDLESIDRADLLEINSQPGRNERVYELEPQEEVLIAKDAKVCCCCCLWTRVVLILFFADQGHHPCPRYIIGVLRPGRQWTHLQDGHQEAHVGKDLPFPCWRHQ